MPFWRLEWKASMTAEVAWQGLQVQGLESVLILACRSVVKNAVLTEALMPAASTPNYQMIVKA